MKLIEVLFEIFKTIIIGVFNLLQVIFGADPEFRKGKYSAKFMSVWDRIRLVSSWNKGVTLGTKRLRVSKGLEHVLVCGGSGSGKTSSVVIPSILNSNNSFICTDVDGSIFAKTSGDLRRRGYSLQVLNLADISRSEFFNPIHYCQNDNSQLKQLAELLINIAYPNSNAESNFWNFGGQQILYIILRLLKTQPPEFQNLANVRYLLQRYSQLEGFVTDYATLDVWNDWLGFTSADEEKVQTGMVSSALVALDKLSDSGVSFLTSKNTLDFSKLTKGKKSAIFIQVPEAKLNFYSFLLSILYTQFFQYIQLNKPKKVVYAYLDEFPALNIKDFPLYAVTMRRYNLALIALIQSESQLLKYGSDGFQTLFNGSFSNKLIFSGMSLNLARQLSQSFGRKGIAIQPQTKPYLSDRELMTVQELVQLDAKKAVYLYRGKAPLIMKIKPYFKQSSLRRKSRIKPAKLAQNTITTPPLIDLNGDNNPLTSSFDEE